jgi:hypothetical protein
MLTMSTPHDELVSKFVSDGALSEEEASTLLVDGKPAPAKVIQLLSDNDALPPGPAN